MNGITQPKENRNESMIDRISSSLPEYLPPLRFIIPHTIAITINSRTKETMRPMNQGDWITRGARSKERKCQ